jgi:hypothetical protein
VARRRERLDALARELGDGCRNVSSIAGLTALMLSALRR